MRDTGSHPQQPCSLLAWSQRGSWRSLRKGRSRCKRTSASVKVCFAFQRTGACNFGAACVFSHDARAVALAAPLRPAKQPTCPCRACSALDHDLATCPLLAEFTKVQAMMEHVVAVMSVVSVTASMDSERWYSEDYAILRKECDEVRARVLSGDLAVRFGLQSHRRCLLLHALGEDTALVPVSARVDPS